MTFVQTVRSEIRVATWRARNLDRILRYRLTTGDDAVASDLADELRREGIAVGQFGEVFGSDEELFPEIAQVARRRLQDGSVESRVAGEMSAKKRKEFKLQLLPSVISINDPLFQLALNRRVLDVAAQYMGMRAYLRSIQLWRDRPTVGAAEETQLWHRDCDDLMNVKVFVYLNDVDLDSGPFCFLPQTHLLGRHHLLMAEHDSQGRSRDEQLENVIGARKWNICVGSAGTVILCDTCGYHKGMKPTRKERLVLTWQYTSGSPRYPRDFGLMDQPANQLSPMQLQALQ